MKHTQIGWTIIILFLLTDLIFVVVCEAGLLIIAAITGFFFIVSLLFYKLTLEVDDKFVKYSFGFGIIHGKFKLSDIKSCKEFRYFPLGWGIRVGPEGTLYNVTGRWAIELEFKNKTEKIYIGTSMPKEFTEYINSKLTV